LTSVIGYAIKVHQIQREKTMTFDIIRTWSNWDGTKHEKVDSCTDREGAQEVAERYNAQHVEKYGNAWSVYYVKEAR
jgi:hypothetical protein